MRTIIRRFGDNVVIHDGDFAEIGPLQRHLHWDGNEYRIAFHEVEEADDAGGPRQRLTVYLDRSA